MRTSLSLSFLLAGLASGCAASDTADLDGASASRRADDSRPELSVALIRSPKVVGLRGAAAESDLGSSEDPAEPLEPGEPAEPEAPVMSWAEPAGVDACPDGGTLFVTFSDVDGDGRPGADEPQTRELRCDEVVSYAALSDSRRIEPGDVCVTGGSAAVSGFDFDFDGMLADREIAESVVTCDAQPLSAAVVEGYGSVSAERGVYAVAAAVDSSVADGSHLNWRITVTDARSGAGVNGVQLAGAVGDNGDAWSTEVLTDIDGVATLSADVCFQLSDDNFGADDGDVLMLQLGAIAPGEYLVRLELVSGAGGEALGRSELAMDVAR